MPCSLTRTSSGTRLSPPDTRNERIHVAYLGVDDNFLAGMPAPEREPGRGKLELVFASRFERRKGADIVCEALEVLGDQLDWSLVIAGPVAADIRKEHRAFLADERVRVLGLLTRPEFKRQLTRQPGVHLPRPTRRDRLGRSSRRSPAGAT